MARTSKAKTSAGILLCRLDPATSSHIEFLLVHPGGPFFARKDAGAWTVPKGLIEPDEDALATALREFGEETGFDRPAPPYVALGQVRQKSGKVVYAWAAAGDADPAALSSNTFTMEWPRGSGLTRSFPEVDRAAFFARAEAEQRIIAAQRPFLERAAGSAELAAALRRDGGAAGHDGGA